MADRYWEQRSVHRYVYVDNAANVGKVIGTIKELFSVRTFDAAAYGRPLGEFVSYADARTAVERACADIEAQRAAAAQADGATE